MIRPLSPLPLTELGRRCSATTSMRLVSGPGGPHGFTRVECDLPRRHRGMHEHVTELERSRLVGIPPRLEITQPRESYAWSPLLVSIAWRLVDLTRVRA